MKEEGYIKLWRRFFNHPLWQEKRTFSKAEAWMWMLKNATYKVENRGPVVGKVEITTKRGQLVASNRYMQQAFGWSNSKVENFLQYLRQQDMIEIDFKNDTKITVITVSNYYYYNSSEEEETTGGGARKNHKKRQSGDSETTVRRRSGDKSNKVNKENNDKKEKDERGAGQGHAPAPPDLRKTSLTKKRREFVEPTKQEVHEYFASVTGNVWENAKAWKQADSFIDHYISNGWIQNGDKPIVDWKAAARNWIRREIDGKFHIKDHKVQPKEKGKEVHKDEATDDIKKERAFQQMISESKDPDGLSIAYLYETFLEGGLKISELFFGYYTYLKNRGLLRFTEQVRSYIMSEAKKMRMTQQIGRALLDAYEKDGPADLLDADKQNLIDCSQRIAILTFFRQCKDKKLTEIKTLLGV